MMDQLTASLPDDLLPEHWRDRAQWITTGTNLDDAERGRLAVMLLKIILRAPRPPVLSTDDERVIFEWLTCRYVQHADERQKAMGLVYMTAETHDLAHQLARLLATRPT